MSHLSRADAAKATSDCTERRLAFLPLLRMDVTKARPADAEGCARSHAMAVSDPMKFDGMLAHPGIVRLFTCGALYFERQAA